MSGFKLIGISSIFHEFFPKGWEDQTDWSIEEERNNAIEKALKNLNKYENEVLLRIGYSMLTGEYVVRSDIQGLLDTVLNDLSIDSTPETGIAELDKLEIKIQQVLNYTLFSIKRYRHFINTIINQYSQNEPTLALNAYSIDEGVIRNSRWHALYDILFSVVAFDHRLSYDRKKLRELILQHSRLEDILHDETPSGDLLMMVTALKDKCFFLLKKLLIYDKSGIDYMVDFELKHISVEDSSPKWLKEMDDAFEFYRKSDTNGDLFGKKLENASYNKNLRLSSYPLLMKYSKDYKNPSEEQINNIIDEFEEKYKKVIGSISDWRVFDLYSLKTIKSYLYNARFDFLISSKKKYSYDEMLIDLKTIEILQNETHIKDFYPYWRAACFVETLLNNRTEISIDKGQEYLDTYNALLEKCSDALIICRNQSFYPIQSSHVDCLVLYEGFGRIFIPSSYCRPLQYDKIEASLKEQKSRAQFYKNALRLDSERKEIENIKDSIDQSRKYTIEIISAFTAIITFLFGTIDFFSDKAQEALPNRVFSILSFGFILLLFVSSIAMVTMRRELSWKHYWKEPRFLFFVVLAMVVVAMLVYLIVACRDPLIS